MSTRASYWKANLRLVTICLVIWFLVSFVFGILLAEPLNAIRIWRLTSLDQKCFGVHED